MKPKRGYLIKNKYKTPEHPDACDYWGKMELGGVTYAISAWVGTSAQEQMYLSLSAKPYKRESIQEKIERGADGVSSYRTNTATDKPQNVNKPTNGIPANAEKSGEDL